MRKVLILFVLVMMSSPALAQSDCGNGLPCGPIPWRLPQFPDLSSPTPMPTLEIPESDINPPGQPTATPAPINTATPIALDTGEIESQLDTLNTLLQQTPLALDSTISLQQDEPVLQDDFTNWSGSCPSDWSCFSQPPNSELLQDPAGVRLIRNTVVAYLNRTVLVQGEAYIYIVNVPEITGIINVYSGDLQSHRNDISAPGIYTFTDPSAATSTLWIRAAGTTGTNAVVSSIEVRPASATLAELGAGAGTFFGYARGLSGDTFGPLAPLVTLTITGMVLIISTKLITFMLPVLAALFGILRKLVVAVLEFLPL